MARTSRHSRRKSQQAVQEAPPEEESFEVEIDETPVPAASASSSRRGARRSSRRSGADASESGGASGKKSAKAAKKSKRAKGPKTDAGGKGSGAATKIVLLLVGVAVLVGGSWLAYEHFREKPTTRSLSIGGEEQTYVGTRSQLARRFWNDGSRQQAQLEKAIDFSNADVAQGHLDALTTLLFQPEIGGGKTKPNPEDETIGDFKLATKAAEILPKLELWQGRINEIRWDAAARANSQHLHAVLAKLVTIDDPTLDKLQTDIERFTQNPVKPDAGPDLAHQQRYRQEIEQLEHSLYEITAERLRRLMKNTTDIVDAINRETQKWIQQDRYGRALRTVDEAMKAYPDAKLAPVRQKVLRSANEAWAGAKTIIGGKIETARSGGNSASAREAARLDAIQRLEHVIERYGQDVDETRPYVDDAERMLSDFRGR